MRGGDEDQPRRILGRGDGHALRVERDGGNDGAGGMQCDVGAAIARAFDPRVVAALEQRIGGQRQAGLRRRHDQDLAGFGLDPAMNHEMPEQGFLQRWMVDRPVAAQRCISRRATEETAPRIVRKLAFVRQSGLKRPRRSVMNRRPVGPVQAACPGRQVYPLASGAVASRRSPAIERQARGYLRTASGGKREVAFRSQLLDRKRDGVARQGERPRELPARRQALAGRKASPGDELSQLVGQLARQRFAAVAGEVEHSGQQVVHNWHHKSAKTGSFIRAS